MYSVVMMMALSGGAEVPQFGFRNKGCNGSRSCAGAVCQGSVGYGCAGNDCCGKKRGGLFGRRKNRGCNGGNGCYGTASCHGYNGCHGAVGCHGYHGAVGCHGGVIIQKTDGEKKVEPNEEKKKGDDTVSAPARLVITVPANAKLFVDNRPTTSTSTRRVFQTPTLPNGSTYSYTLRAEVVTNGQTAVQSQTVSFRAGETRKVQFNFAQGAVAASR